MSEVLDTQYTDMDDEAFESVLSSGDFTSDTAEAPSEPLSVSEDEVDESYEEDVNSSENASDEQLEHDEEGVTDEEEETDPDYPDEETEEEETSEEASEDSDEQAEPEPSELDELYKPFKASGKEVSVKSIEEAKKLMSMGVDYSVKLQGFKQHRSTIKTLQKNEIDEATLNYLIDLKNGNPQAISKLLKEGEIDPLDLDVEEDSSYTPSDHSVSPSQVDLDDVIDRIQSTDTFATTSDIVTNQWDVTSKKAIYAKPQYLEILNAHVANGTYTRVMQEVERSRMLGDLHGLSDLEAYDKVGAQLFSGSQEVPTKRVSTAPKQQPNTDRKRKASPSKNTSKAVKPKYNYADMSDDEFEKLLEGN